MFTINDIKPLVMVAGAKAVVIKFNPEDTELSDETMRKNVANLIKKATKLPVIFIAKDVDITIEKDIEKYGAVNMD